MQAASYSTDRHRHAANATAKDRLTLPVDAQVSRSAIGVPFEVSPRCVLWSLLAVVAVLASTSLAVQWLHHGGGYSVPTTLLRRLDLDGENNIPTWFSSAILAIAGILLTVIARAKFQLRQPYVLHWAGLALIFVGLSLDETASLHEAAGALVRRLLDTSGALYSAWVIPAMVFLVMFGAIYLRFLLSLPRRTAAWFVFAGLLFVGGALGLEMVGWHYRYPMHALNPTDWDASKNFTYALINHAEEVLEMTGTIVFIYALLCYIAADRLTAVVKFGGRA